MKTKQLVIGLVVGMLIGHVLPNSAATRQVTLPDLPFEVKAVVDILTDYSVKHYTDSPMGKAFYGLTDADAKVIWINDNQSFASKRDTVIHELLHVMYENVGISTYDIGSEHVDMAQAVVEKTHGIFMSLYGLAPVVPGQVAPPPANCWGGLILASPFPVHPPNQ